MSRIVNDPERYLGMQVQRGRQVNWSRWVDGKMHELKAGFDWPAGITAHSKRSSFRQWAARQPGVTAEFMSKRVHTWVPESDTLVILVDGGLPRVPETDPVSRRRHQVQAELGDVGKDLEAISRRRGRKMRS